MGGTRGRHPGEAPGGGTGAVRRAIEPTGDGSAAGGTGPADIGTTGTEAAGEWPGGDPYRTANPATIITMPTIPATSQGWARRRSSVSMRSALDGPGSVGRPRQVS